MESVLAFLPTFNAKDPHDVVFAVRSLAKDSLRLVPDYSKSAVRVFKEVIQNTVTTTGSLNVICRPWAPIISYAPSWIPQLSGHPFTVDSFGTYLRTRADISVGLPDQRVYKTSGSTPTSATFNDNEKSFILTAKGFQLSSFDSVGRLGQPATNGIVLAAWSKTFMSPAYKNETGKDMYWRTLVGNRDDQGNIPPPLTYRICEDMYEERVQKFG
jgi:hypothetical protein